MRISKFSLLTDISAYLLRDKYKGTLSGGSINNTQADTGQVRAVVDANSKLSIGSNVLNFATGGAGANDPLITYSGINKVPGMVLLGTITPANTTGDVAFGYSNAAAGTTGRTAFRFFNDATIRVRINEDGTEVNTGFVYVGATTYQLALIARNTGSFFFIKGGIYTYWTLIFISGSTISPRLFPNIGSFTGTVTILTASDFKIPNNFIFIPLPTASDGFDRVDGALGVTDGLAQIEGYGGSGLTWTGSTWAIVSGVAVNTPTLGADDVINGGFGADTDWSKGTGVTIAGGKGVFTASTGTLQNSSEANSTVGVWYQVTVDASGYGGSNGLNVRPDGTNTILPAVIANGSVIRTTRALAAGKLAFVPTASLTLSVDNATRKPLTLASLFAELTTNQVADSIVQGSPTLIPGTQAGIVMNLDSTSSPANFIIAYHDGVNMHLDKCVAGVYTSLISAAATYSAGAVIRVVKLGTRYTLLYNNVRIGTSQTVSDVGIISNTIHGLFSTYSGNSIDSFVCRPTGANNEYSVLDGV